MAENLWQMRRQRGMSAKQLAAKAGIPVETIHQYEQGQPLRPSDIGKLAKAMFVNEFAIKIRSDPKPEARPAPKAAPKAEEQAKPKPKTAEKKNSQPKPQQHMARPGQIEHLFNLGVAMDVGKEEIIAEIGQPPESLTLQEIRDWLRDYSKRVKEYKEKHGLLEDDSNRPPGTRRKRAELPEGVDEFELNYLTERQEAGDTLHFVLLNGETAAGKVIGFSPYSITIHTEDGREMVVEKLALAYYYREAAQ